MNTTYSLEDYDKMIRRLGEAFYQWVIKEMADKQWRRAVFEARYARDGSYWHDKMRVEIPEGSVVSLSTNQDIRQLLNDLNHLRNVLGWYSFTLDVDRHQKVTIEYNYDPDSADDPSFFED